MKAHFPKVFCLILTTGLTSCLAPTHGRIAPGAEYGNEPPAGAGHQYRSDGRIVAAASPYRTYDPEARTTAVSTRTATGSTYYHQGRTYTGGRYESGNFRDQGRSYDNRYYYNGQYYYGGSPYGQSPYGAGSPGDGYPGGTGAYGPNGRHSSPYQNFQP